MAQAHLPLYLIQPLSQHHVLFSLLRQTSAILGNSRHTNAETFPDIPQTFPAVAVIQICLEEVSIDSIRCFVLPVFLLLPLIDRIFKIVPLILRNLHKQDIANYTHSGVEVKEEYFTFILPQ
jgi:hypothetical protein